MASDEQDPTTERMDLEPDGADAPEGEPGSEAPTVRQPSPRDDDQATDDVGQIAAAAEPAADSEASAPTEPCPTAKGSDEAADAPFEPGAIDVTEPMEPVEQPGPPDQAEPVEQSAPSDPPKKASRRKRRLRLRYPIVGLMLIGAVLYVLANARTWIHQKTVEEARRRGIELSLGEVDLDWSQVRLKHFQFTLVGMGGVRGYVEVLRIDHEDLTPTRLEARGVSLQLEGSAAALAMTFSEWTKNHPSLLRIPAKASWVDVVWRPQPGMPEWLRIDDATIEPTPRGGTFRANRVRVFDIDIGLGETRIESDDDGASVTAESVRVAGIDLGKVGTSWTGDLSHIALGFGEDELERAPVTIDVAYAQAAPQAKILLKPTPLERLAAPLGVALPIEGVTASGTAELTFRGGPLRGPIAGKLHATFEGYAPPVPRELGAIVFGKTTHLSTELAVSDDRRVVQLDKTAVQHGAFKLAGSGRIERHADHATITLELKGQLRCTDLADAAARSRVGGAIGGLLGGAARLTLRGSVAVGLKIEADTRNLKEAKLTKNIGIGCGLRSLGDLPIPKLPVELPELPSFGTKGARESEPQP